MALKKTIQSNFGIEIPSAYHRVGRIEIFKKSEMAFIVSAFANDQIDSPVQTKQYACAYDLAGQNALAQAYEHLKTLPEFTGAIDC
jgi:hypothetical protein